MNSRYPESPGSDERADVWLVEDLRQQRLPARRLASVLQQAGLSAQLVQLPDRDDLPDLVASGLRTRPQLVVLSLLFAHRVGDHLELLTRLKQSGVHAHGTVTGPLAAFGSELLLAQCAELESVIVGQPDSTVVSLASSLHSGADWRQLAGLAYRDGGSVRVNGLPREAPSLDPLPWPRRDEVATAESGYSFATVEASQGCWHACRFCLPCAWLRARGSAYRMRRIQSLLQEMRSLYERGVRLFLFDDEQFLAPGAARLKRVEALATGLAGAGMQIAFTIKSRPDDVERELFSRLREAGLVRVYLGVESGCATSLDRFGKGFAAECNLEALSVLRELDLVTDFRSLICHPWTTVDTVVEDLEFHRRALPVVRTLYDFREVEVYPGTAMADDLCGEARGVWREWTLRYELADPAAELARRIARLVFAQTRSYRELRERHSRAWFDLLVQRRLGQGEQVAAAAVLDDCAQTINSSALDIWSELLTFVARRPLPAAAEVNALAAQLSLQLGEACLRAAGQLATK